MAAIERLLGTVWWLTRLLVPIVWRMFMYLLSWLATAFAAFWSGVPAAAEAIATEWRNRACDAGFPTRWDSHLYYAFWIIALGMIVVGWVVLSYLTITVIRWIF